MNQLKNIFLFCLFLLLSQHIQAQYTDSKNMLINPRFEQKILYPAFKASEKDIALREINQVIKDSVTHWFKEFHQNHQQYVEEQGLTLEDSLPVWGQWTLDVSYKIAYASKNYISLYFEFYEFTGGAHGIMYYKSFNFRINKNKIQLLALNDIFKDKSLVNPFIYETLSSEGWMVKESDTNLIDKNQAFVIDTDKITFLNGQYVFGAYVDGPTVYSIAWDKLKKNLRFKIPE